MTNNPGTYEEVCCDVIAETGKALRIDTGGDRLGDDCHWVPKSLLDPEEHDNQVPHGVENDTTLWVQRWFVEKEGIQ